MCVLDLLQKGLQRFKFLSKAGWSANLVRATDVMVMMEGKGGERNVKDECLLNLTISTTSNLKLSVVKFLPGSLPRLDAHQPSTLVDP